MDASITQFFGKSQDVIWTTRHGRRSKLGTTSVLTETNVQGIQVTCHSSNCHSEKQKPTFQKSEISTKNDWTACLENIKAAASQVELVRKCGSCPDFWQVE